RACYYGLPKAHFFYLIKNPISAFIKNQRYEIPVRTGSHTARYLFWAWQMSLTKKIYLYEISSRADDAIGNLLPSHRPKHLYTENHRPKFKSAPGSHRTAQSAEDQRD